MNNMKNSILILGTTIFVATLIFPVADHQKKKKKKQLKSTKS
jgi:hypothetical protein